MEREGQGSSAVIAAVDCVSLLEQSREVQRIDGSAETREGRAAERMPQREEAGDVCC